MLLLLKKQKKLLDFSQGTVKVLLSATSLNKILLSNLIFISIK